MSKKRTKKRKWVLITPKTDTKPAESKVVEIDETSAPEIPEFKEDEQVVITKGENGVPNVTVANTNPTLPPPPPSREQQMARMLFVDFFTNALQITRRFETSDIVIEPIKESEFVPNGKDEIKVYSVVSKSNPNVTSYISEKEITVTYKGATTKLKNDEIIYLATNILGYVREAYKKLA